MFTIKSLFRKNIQSETCIKSLSTTKKLIQSRQKHENC